ncbi:MAG: protein kinase domain-containing protein, partial [Candidatus Eiseniibacteriota bacterium]
AGGGTAAYVAPEVWKGLPAGKASDLYAAGVVLYEMATGVQPFHGLPSIAEATLHLPPPHPRQRNPAVSPEFEAVILRLLRKDPAQRFASAGELIQALEAIHARGKGAPAPLRRRWTRVGVATAALLVLGALGWWLVRDRGPVHSLAVLVPENTRRDPAVNQLAIPVTEALISSFGGVPRLRVMSLTTMLHYMPPAPRKPIRQIAQELDVDRVVEGSMLIREDRLRLALRLYSTAVVLPGSREEVLIWNGVFDGDRRDVFDLKSHVVDSIVRVIGLRLDGDQGPGESSVDPVANEEYYQGRYQWNRRSDEGIRNALDHFQRAVARDSGFALAYSGLADAWATAGIGGMIPPIEASPPAKRAAQRALALNPKLSEAWVSLGNIQQNFDWNWSGAGRAYRKAIDLNPNNAHAHHWYANHLALRGRFAPALAEIRLAQELDPLSLPVNIGAGAFHYYARRYEEALVEYRRIFDLDSTSALLNRAMAATYIRLGREADAAGAIQRWLDHQYPGELASRAAEGHRRGGLTGMVRVLIGAFEARRASGQYAPATHIAELYSLLPDHERALWWLSVAYEEHDTQLNRLKVDPIFDPLRGDPRFADLMRKVGLARRARCGAALTS